MKITRSLFCNVGSVSWNDNPDLWGLATRKAWQEDMFFCLFSCIPKQVAVSLQMGSLVASLDEHSVEDILASSQHVSMLSYLPNRH